MNANTSVEQQNGKSDTSHEVLKWLLQTCVGILMMAAILFVPAGRLDWIMGWAYIGVSVLVTAVTPLVADPELLIEERGPGKEGSKSWDKILVSIYSLVSPALVTPLIAALDMRFGWLPQIPLTVGAHPGGSWSAPSHHPHGAGG